MSNKIELGNRVKDITSGFEGIAIARCEFLDGRVSFGIQAQVSPGDDKLEGVEYIPESYLQLIDEGIHVAPITYAIGFKSTDKEAA